MANLREVIRRALPDKVFFTEKPLIGQPLIQRVHNKFSGLAFPRSNFIDCYSSISFKYDLVVLSGPWISGRGSDVFLKFVKDLSEKSIPYCFMSAGSYKYNDEEVSTWSRVFEKYPPYIFTSRDDYTFEKYGAFATHSLKSICASFLSPINFPRFETKSLVGCWDDNGVYSFAQLKEIAEQLGYGHCFTYRAIIDPFSSGNLLKLKIRRSPVPCLISPSFHDYLDYYSQTHLMVSSRVHCCAPTIAYGGKAVLVNKTGRKRLFHSAGAQAEPLHGTNLEVLSISTQEIANRYTQLLDFLKRPLQLLLEN